MEELPKNIRMLRHKKGWSQGDFATRMGISVPAFSKIELGVTDITLSRLQQIAHNLEMPLMELLTYNDTQSVRESTALHAANQTIKTQMADILDLQKQVITLHEEVRKLSKEAEDKPSNK